MSDCNDRKLLVGNNNSGYRHSLYAESLAEFGTPRKLSHCNAWILERQIADSDYRDAMGCYPIFCCQDWSKIPDDLNEICTKIVSIVIVTDTFANLDMEDMRKSFSLVKLFKEHFVVDLAVPPDKIISSHHRYRSKKALRQVRVELCERPLDYLNEWFGLYNVLIKRHRLTGVKAFSLRSFKAMLAIPGMLMFRAIYQDQCIGAQLWLIDGNVAYAHLLGMNEVGYDYSIGASYALYWTAIQTIYEKYDGQVLRLDLGSGAGISCDGQDGLSRFKKGWANTQLPVWLCGQIFNPKAYSELKSLSGINETNYFPAYRLGEYGESSVGED